MKPILKYRGGKSSEINNILPHIPDNYNRYIEPFFGGGALYFYLESENSIINDINTKLIDFYKDVAFNYANMKPQLDEIKRIYIKNQLDYEKRKSVAPEMIVPNDNEQLYYHMRDLFNNNKDKEYLDSVIYYYINKTAYSGMIRYNKKGEFNVPFGRYKNLNTDLLTINHHNLLNSAEIYNEDYAKIFNMANNDDFMFLDPPYDTTFSDYGNGDDFSEEQHRKLSQDFKNLSCKSLMIISRTQLIEELYKGFIVEDSTYNKKYGVNIRNRFNRDAEHVVIRNYDHKNLIQFSFLKESLTSIY